MPFEKPPAGLSACELAKWISSEMWREIELSFDEGLSSAEIGLTGLLIRSLRNAGNKWSIIEKAPGREEAFTGSDLYMVIIDSQGRSMALYIQSKRLNVEKGKYDALKSNPDDEQIRSLISYSEVDRFELGIRALPVYFFYNYCPAFPKSKKWMPQRGDIMDLTAECAACMKWRPVGHFGITVATAFELRAAMLPLNKLNTVHSFARPWSCLFCCNGQVVLSVPAIFQGMYERVPQKGYVSFSGLELSSSNCIANIEDLTGQQVAQKIAKAVEQGADTASLGDVVIYDERKA